MKKDIIKNNKRKNNSYNTDELYFYPKKVYKVFLKYLTQNQVCMQLLGWYLHLSWPCCQLPAGLAWSWKLYRYDLSWPCCQLPAGLIWSWKLFRYDLSWPCCLLPSSSHTLYWSSGLTGKKGTLDDKWHCYPMF